MNIVPKLNLNRNYKDVPSNSIVAAKNMIIDDTGSYYTNEWGFKVAFECPNDTEFICGVIPTNKELIIFTYCSNDKKSRIYRYNKNGTYTECNIGWTYSGGKITGSYTYNYKEELIIAVGEYDAVDINGNSIQVPYKCWNLDNAIATNHNQEEEIGNINGSFNFTAGNLVCGVYTIFIRFTLDKNNYTKWFQLTSDIIITQSVAKEAPIHVYMKGDTKVTLPTTDKDGNSIFKDFTVNTNTISDTGICLIISGLEESNFNNYQIGYIIKHDEEVLGRIQGDYSINDNVINIINNDYIEEESIDEFLKNPNQLYNVKNIINYNNRIYLSNYEEYKNEKFNVDVDVSFENKEPSASEVVTNTIKGTGQISLNYLTSGIDHTDFDITDLTKDDNGNYHVNNPKSFIKNYIINTIKYVNVYGTYNITSICTINNPDFGDGFNYQKAEIHFLLAFLDQQSDSSRTYCYIYDTIDGDIINNAIKDVYFDSNGIIHFVTKWSNYVENQSSAGEHDYVSNNMITNLQTFINLYRYTDTGNVIFVTGPYGRSCGYLNGWLEEELSITSLDYPRFPKHGFPITASISVTTNSYLYKIDVNDINRSLIFNQRYNLFIHYIRKDGSFTNGYNIGVFTPNNQKIIYPVIKVNYIPDEFIGYFISYEDVEYNVSPAHVVKVASTDLGNDVYLTTTPFIYENESINGDKFCNNYSSIESATDIKYKTYNRDTLSTPNIEIQHIEGTISPHDDFVQLITSINNQYGKKVKTLYRLSKNYYDIGIEIKDSDYLPNFYNREKIITYRTSEDETELGKFIFSPTSSAVVDNLGAEKEYRLGVCTEFNYAIKPLNAYNIKQDYNKGAVSLITSNGTSYGVFYNSVISPDRLHDFLEIKGAYTAKPSKSFTNYSEDYTDKFDKTVRRSNVISDESLVNGFRIFESEEYKIIKENKGNITNIVGIGLYLLVHTEYSLFVFDRSPKLTNSSQLQIPDTFDIDYQEVLPSNEGFGGLTDKEESIISKNGYIWYDSINKYIFKYENGKASVLSSDINNFLKDLNVDTVRFGEDLKFNRLIICIYVNVDKETYPITVSYNFNTNSFISLHDYSFTNCYRTYEQAYFFDENKDGNRLYSFDETESTYKNLRNKQSIYYTKYSMNDDSSGSKPGPGSLGVSLTSDTIVNALNGRCIRIKLSSAILAYKYIRLITVDDSEHEWLNTDTYDYLYKDPIIGWNIEIDKLKNYVDVWTNFRPTTSIKNIKEIKGYLYTSKENYENKLNGVPIISITPNDETNLIVDYIEDVPDPNVDNIVNDIWSFHTNQTLLNSYSLGEIYSSISFKNIETGDIDTPTSYICLGETYTINWRNYIAYYTITKNNIIKKYTVTVNHPEFVGYAPPEINRKEDIVSIKNVMATSVAANMTIKGYANNYELYNQSFTEMTKGQIVEIDDMKINKIVVETTGIGIEDKTYILNIDDNLGSISCNNTADGKVTFYTSNKNITEVYWTKENRVPTINDNKYTIYKDVINIKNSSNFNVAIIITDDDGNIIIRKDYTFYCQYSKNQSNIINYTTQPLSDDIIKNYIDVIYCVDTSETKVLESIHYILNELKDKFNINNPAEQLLNRRFSGNSIIIYSDETYSGAININDEGKTNYLNEYKVPSFQKGYWSFNYFRNDVSRVIENGTFIAVYYDSETKTYKTRVISDEELKQRFKNNPADNESLIYGKYIVARFIFDNDKRVKFEDVTFITNPY